MKTWRINLVLFLSLIAGTNLFGQKIFTSPESPTANEEVVVTVDIEQCSNQSMLDYTGQAYVHIGLITSESTDNSDWRYVPMSWGENSPCIRRRRMSFQKLGTLPSGA